MVLTLALGFAWTPALEAAGTSASDDLHAVERWCALLNADPAKNDLFLRQLSQADLVILDGDDHPPLASLRGRTRLIAYVSVGEAEDYRFYWERIRDRPWVLEENPRWKGNFYVDVRAAEWRRLLLEEVIPPILAQGFEGLFLDTLDTAVHLQDRNPQRFAGIREAMVALVRDLRRRFPDALLISNNGFEMLEAMAPHLSGALAEDLYSMPDFKGGYRPVPERERLLKVEVLQRVRREYDLPVFVMDYADTRDQARVWALREKIRALGFNPYIAEPGLSKVHTVNWRQ